MDDMTKEQCQALHDQIKGLREGAVCPENASPLDRLAFFGLHFFEVVLAHQLAGYPADKPPPVGAGSDRG
jgi:hypothetical protein